MKNSANTPRDNIICVLKRQTPEQFVFSPNLWQWFSHHKNHNRLPEEVANCQSQFDLLNYLGVDIFSRNLYCDQKRVWFAGLSKPVYDGVEVTIEEKEQGNDVVFDKTYHTKAGTLTERLRYVWSESTLVQEKFLIDDYKSQLDAFEQLLMGTRWVFSPEQYNSWQEKMGSDGINIAGELFSPLKMLHFAMNPIETTYLITDFPERAAQLTAIHQQSLLELADEMVKAGVPAIMSMDNLDTMFHPPAYVEKYSADYYEKASQICHQYDSTFFIHACGQQKDNLKFIASLGVDGLEGICYPPLGDISLKEAFEMTGDKFILTGGISAIETGDLTTKKQIFDYVKNLFAELEPYKNRFVFSSSCNTSVNTSFETIKLFRDAWLEYR